MAFREITHHALDVADAPEDAIKTLVDFSVSSAADPDTMCGS